MKRFLVLSLCTVLFLIPCFAESIDFPEGYILNANIFSVKGNALSESQISVHIMTVEDPTVKLISQSLSGCSFLKLTGVEYGNEVYTVLLAKTLSAADETVALYCFAVAQTLIQNGFCSGVNVLIDGACPAVDGIPLNTVYGCYLGRPRRLPGPGRSLPCEGPPKPWRARPSCPGHRAPGAEYGCRREGP